MSNITVTGNQAYFNEDVKFFKNVYIYGRLYYDFLKDGLVNLPNVNVNGDLSVTGNGTFGGDLSVTGSGTFGGNLSADGNLSIDGSSFFNKDVYIEEDLSVRDLLVRRRLDVGIGGTILTTDDGSIGIANSLPRERLDVVGNSLISGRVGIGTTLIDNNNDKLLYVAGSVRIANDIYDSLNYDGDLGAFLTKDVTGIKWTPFAPRFAEGIDVYNDEALVIKRVDGTVVGVTSFTGLNLKSGNLISPSLRTDPGIGVGLVVDPVQAYISTSGPFIADIYTFDFWELSSGGPNIFRNTNVGIKNANPSVELDVTGSSKISSELDVGGLVEFYNETDSSSKTNGTLVVTGGVGIGKNLNVGGNTDIDGTLNVGNITTLESTVDSTSKNDGALQVKGGTGILLNLNVGGNTDIDGTLNVGNITTLESTVDSTSKNDGALQVKGGVGIVSNLNIGGNTKVEGTLELDKSLIDVNNSTAAGKFDYRLSSVGTGVSWRPPGVQTQNAIWVTMDGNDSNTGFLEGDAKRTIGAAASVAQEGDTIFVRSGVYFENNPIGLRTDVSVSGQDLRLVTIIPINSNKDVFHVRRGCLIENVSFAGTNISVAHTGAGAIAFPPTSEDVSAGIAYSSVTGYLDPGPATEGSSGRWKSPYIRNCTNFMTKSIGMKINGDHATASTIGADLKCMVCDSFTQYNENGIGVSLTNNAYAQLVSIFTINCDIGIYAASGGSCDLTNSNSSFGNYGLYAVGLGKTEFTAQVGTYPPNRTQPGVDAGSDRVTFLNMSDEIANPRRPYDGQALFFKIDLDNYPDAQGIGILQEPMVQIQEIKVLNGGFGFSPLTPPTIFIRDDDDFSQQPKGPQGIIAELSPTIDEITGEIISIDVVNSGRNYLASQKLKVFIDGGEDVGAAATVITQPIYYTVDVATAPNVNHRFADANSLIYKNIDFIATEAVDRVLDDAYSIPNGLIGKLRCIEDIKLVTLSIMHNLQFGGNDRVYDAAKVYVDNPSYLSGEVPQSIVAYNYARDVCKQIINNVSVTKRTGILNQYTQVKDLTLIADPNPGSGSTSNTNPDSCTNVKDAIDTYFAIITTAINPASSPRLPTSRTIGNTAGITTVTFNEFIPYELFGNEEVSLKRISRILTSSHSFEYIGTGVDINTSTPFKGSVPIKENEIVALDGAQVPFTSTDQKGNFDIGEGFQINQPTATIRGRDFSKAIQAEVTPLILALR